MYPIFPDPS